MNELRIDIGGDSRGFQLATDKTLGIVKSMESRIAEDRKRKEIQATDDYVGFWTRAIDKREAAEKAASERDIANFRKNLEEKWALNAAMAEIAKGSGGYGSMPSASGGSKTTGKHGGTAGMVAGQAAMDAASGSTMGEVSKGAMMLAGGMGIQHFVEKLWEGKLEGLRKLPREIMHVVEGFAEWGKWILRAGGVMAAIVGAEEIARAAIHAGRSADESNKSNARLGAQTGDLRGRLGGMIDDHEKAGVLDSQHADALRRQLHSHEGIVAVQKELIRLQDVSLGQEAAAALHKQTLARLSVFQREEAESTVNAQTRLAMLLGDERDLKNEIAAADKAHDEETFLEKSRKLLNKQREIFTTTKDVRDAYNNNKHDVSQKIGLSSHVDSLSSAGLFTSVGAVTNPMVDIGRQQLSKLEEISQKIGAQKDIFAQ